MTSADLGKSPVTGHASVALEPANAGLALALSGLGIARVRYAAQTVAVAETRTSGAVRSEGRGLSVRTTTVPRVEALDHLDALNWNRRSRSAMAQTIFEFAEKLKEIADPPFLQQRAKLVVWWQ